ncbi:hypothetical protein MGU_06382 [Metarhizium guizhouense ARSEF 977]|uniref:Uncharacterized protein n=1 Tax=Metarhizium guizhouense (strain ARSEF 977) TaxID=1276136 RepID=A0A0B4GHT0_METGA|nr:hypothetical protein MGU_06382 [Metarhizium guizhouense ARSEF 977]
MDSEDQMSVLARKRLESRDIDYMKALDDMMRTMETYLKQKDQPNWYGSPFANLLGIEYEKVLKLTAELGALLGLYGQLKKAEEKVGKAEVGAVFVAKPNAQQHLENRNKSKPDQPKAEVDAEKEVNWLEAAMIMQAVQKYVRDSELDDMIQKTYGIKKATFCGNFQRYIWIFLGQGSEEGLPWSHDPKWRKWRLSRGVHPNFKEVLGMWHNGLDIYDILERLGPLSEASLQRTRTRRKMETASHGSPGPSN